MKKVYKLLNEYADEFVMQHSADILIGIRYQNSSFSKYMQEENTFNEFVERKADSDLLELGKSLGYSDNVFLSDNIQKKIGNKIKNTLYELIKIRVHDEIQTEINRIENDDYYNKEMELIVEKFKVELVKG